MRNALLNVTGMGLMVFTLNAHADVLLWGFKVLSFTDKAAKVTANQSKKAATDNTSTHSSTFVGVKITENPSTKKEQSKVSDQQHTITELDFKIKFNNNVTYQELVDRGLLNQADLEALQQLGEIRSRKDLVSLEKFQTITKLLSSESKRIYSNICPENYRPNQREEGVIAFDNPCLTTSNVP
ncbi:MAG: hypothetical protein WAQ53_11015 [Thiofilum sp.]|uniref:hypothetical protein n=1 Tax=Thiofilum sp. TaxID=2212733 RepID=UPI0025DB466E|nr:hypothetical protein [Thiofilum sp.]MBK8452718.1 hypothetical protein [Thiofilum sp.]